MSAFTSREIEYLESQTMGRLATVGSDGRPHIVPLTYRYNADEDTIDLGGIDFANTKKWRDAQGNPLATFLVDDFSPTEAHAVEIRGDAEVHETGGEDDQPPVPPLRAAVHPAAAPPHRELGPGRGHRHDRGRFGHLVPPASAEPSWT